MATAPDHLFDGARVLITGGLGFIGSTLAIRLVHAGARVTLVDAMIPEYGGNLFNIEPVRGRVTINFGDMCDRLAMDWLIRDQDYVFHLAGQVSHVRSLTDPFPDIEYNIKGTAVVMEAVRRLNPRAKVIFTGTRGQYGPAANLPVNEDAPTNPKAIYEISNLTAEKIIQVYHHTHRIPAVLLRLTNIYGPRAQMKHSQYGVVNWFVRLSLDGTPINVFGDGRIHRDFLYVDDCVEALLRCAVSERASAKSSTSASTGRRRSWSWRRPWPVCATAVAGNLLRSRRSARRRSRATFTPTLPRFAMPWAGSRSRHWATAYGGRWIITAPTAPTTGTGRHCRPSRCAKRAED
jgi:UDP-glucose 4-epimerase